VKAYRMNPGRKWALRGAGALTLALCALTATAAKVGDVTASGNQWLVAQADSQKRVDTLSDQRRDLANDYRTTLRETEGLKLYLQQLRSQLKSQEEEMGVIRQESS